MKYKQINENWQQFLTEQNQNEPTLGQFVQALNKSKRGKVAMKVISFALKKGAAAAATAATAGVAGGEVAGYLEDATDALIEKGAEVLGGIYRSYKNMPDDEAEQDPIAKYFDIDDGFQAALRGGDNEDGPLLKQFEKEYVGALEKELQQAYKAADDNTRNQPLSLWLRNELTANQNLKNFVKDYFDKTKGVVLGKEE